MTPMISAAPTRTAASTEKLVMAASFHTSGVSSTDLPVEHRDEPTGLSAATETGFSWCHLELAEPPKRKKKKCSNGGRVSHVLHDGVFGYFLHDEQGTQRSRSELQNSELWHGTADKLRVWSVFEHFVASAVTIG